MRLTLHDETEDLRLQQAFQKETVTFRELSLSKKLEYIYDYYRWKILVAIAIVATVIIGARLVIENNKEVVLYANFVNTQLVDQEHTDLMDNFVNEKQIDMKNKRIVLNCSLKINHSSADLMSMNSAQSMMAMFGTNEMDVVVQDEKTYANYASLGGYVDLEELLSEEQLARYRDLLVYTEGPEGEGRHAYGINVTDSPRLREEGAYIVDAIFTICRNASQTEHALQFLDYLMGN